MKRLGFAFCVALVVILYVVVNYAPAGHAQAPQTVHVYSTPLGWPEHPRDTQVSGRIIGFSCTSEQCYVATTD